MKPLKLKINAFGPYASYEEVDFTKLDSIYLVTGPTGAGKTSIFDALCFALFGETSGKTREQRDLKSDFASEDEVTYVELEFLLHGESYTIRREPTQSMKGRKTLRGHNVELHLPDEKLITKVADVKDKIEELLGLNIEQFRQIVMLPQGEFRKLIESSTEEKEKIFRKIFSSEVYKNFSDKLKEKSMAMRRDVEKSLDRRKTLLKKIEPGENKKLRELLVLDNMNVLQVIEETNSQVNEDIKVLMELDSKQRENNIIIENNTRAIEKALEINLKIDNILKLKEEIEDLKSREDEIKGIELKSNKAKCAQGILAHENNFNEAKKILERKSEDVIRAGLSFESAKNILKIAKEKLERANRKDSEKKSLEKLLHTLESKVNDFKKYEEDKKQYNNKKISLDKTEISITEGLDNIRSNKLAVNEIEEYIEKIKGIDGEIVLLETTNRDNESDVLYLREFYVRLTNFKKLIENHRKLSLDYDDISRVYLDKNNYYEEKSEELKKEQAGILALKLVEGDECPVCGSINHPKKAISSASHLSELQMKKLKEELEGIKKDKEQKLNEASIALAKIQEMETGTISDGMKKLLPHIEFSRDKVPEILGEAENKGKLLRDELSIIVATLNEKRRLQGIREEKKQVREKLLKEIDALDINIKILENDKLEYFGKCEALKESINEFEKSKGEGISSLIQLEEKISNISIQVTSIEDEIIGAQRYEKEADGNMHSESKNIENKTYEENEARNILNERTKTFYERLSEDNISYEEYNKSKLELHEIKLLDNEVKTYRERVFSKGEILKVTEEEVRGKEKVDINKLEEEKIEIENLRENIQTQIKILFSRNENNKNIILAVNSLGVDLQKQEGEYSIISELSNLANGNNSKRITFERYVLLYHFNEIIQAANIRFRSMTNERYYLQRKVDVGDRRTSQGLDFDVYDNYTGKVRSIGSLSGGESFKASLSLALGLSDVIHSSTGGVRIDTMFVDEGFGTLDPESLEKAIETLLDLGSNGRVVGIISHVSELRERIKSKIEVDKTRQGSSIKIIQE